MEKWFKFYSADFLIDGKMRNLNAEERSCWITLLCLADTSDIPGEVNHLEIVDLFLMSNINPASEMWDEPEKYLEKLEKLHMIRNDNGMITILNFRKRQGKALSTYQRVKLHRESKANDNDLKRNDNAVITKSNEVGSSKKRREEKRINTSKIRVPKVTQESDESKFVNSLMGAFKEFLNPHINFANKTQRKAAENLIKNYGLEDTVANVKLIAKLQAENTPYLPVITSPLDLYDKWAKVINFFKKRGDIE